MTNIYFAVSIRAGRNLQPTYEAIVHHLQQGGHVVLSEHVASVTVEADERQTTDQRIFTQDIALLEQSDAVIAEVTVPSLGVGFEIAYALHHLGKPVLCLCQRGFPLSAMLAGNTDPKMRVMFYQEVTEAQRAAEEFLMTLG